MSQIQVRGSFQITELVGHKKAARKLAAILVFSIYRILKSNLIILSFKGTEYHLSSFVRLPL